MTFIFALLASLAFGQPFNSEGFEPVPGNDTLTEVWDSTRIEDKSGVLLEYSSDPLEVHTLSGGEEFVTPYVSDVVVVNFLGKYRLSDRVGLGVSLPVYATQTFDSFQPGLGDSRVFLPIRFGNMISSVSLIPFVGVPGLGTGDFLTDSQLTGGGLVAGTVDRKGWTLSANVGAHFRPDPNFLNLDEGTRLITSFAAQKIITNRLYGRVELVADPALDFDIADPELTEFPVEVNLAGVARLGRTTLLSFGGSKSVTKGASAADFRVFSGIQWRWMKRPEEPDCGEVNIAFDGAVLDPETGSMEVLDATMIVFDRDRSQVVAEVPLKFMRGISVTFGPGNYVVGYLVREKVVKVEDDSLILLEPIRFDFDKADIRVEDSKEVLDDLVSVLSEHDEIVLLEVGGHTDERGTVSYNDELSKRRTQAVVDYLTEAGIDPARLVPVGYGEGHLLDENCETEECHERNRRVVFTILDGSSD